MTFDRAGNLYGTTSGGAGIGGGIYELAAPDHSKLTYLATFGPTLGGSVDPGGSRPQGTLLIDAAENLCGTAVDGGLPSNGAPNFYYGNGVVFKLAADHHTSTVLYRFTGEADGENPYPGLVADFAGNLYGTTQGGPLDANGQTHGTVFELSGTGFVP